MLSLLSRSVLLLTVFASQAFAMDYQGEFSGRSKLGECSGKIAPGDSGRPPKLTLRGNFSWLTPWNRGTNYGEVNFEKIEKSIEQTEITNTGYSIRYNIDYRYFDLFCGDPAAVELEIPLDNPVRKKNIRLQIQCAPGDVTTTFELDCEF